MKKRSVFIIIICFLLSYNLTGQIVKKETSFNNKIEVILLKHKFINFEYPYNIVVKNNFLYVGGVYQIYKFNVDGTFVDSICIQENNQKIGFTFFNVTYDNLGNEIFYCFNFHDIKLFYKNKIIKTINPINNNHSIADFYIDTIGNVYTLQDTSSFDNPNLFISLNNKEGIISNFSLPNNDDPFCNFLINGNQCIYSSKGGDSLTNFELGKKAKVKCTKKIYSKYDVNMVRIIGKYKSYQLFVGTNTDLYRHKDYIFIFDDSLNLKKVFPINEICKKTNPNFTDDPYFFSQEFPNNNYYTIYRNNIYYLRNCITGSYITRINIMDILDSNLNLSNLQ